MRSPVLCVVIALAIQQLPAPFATPWYRKPTRVVPMPDGHQLTVPSGFTVNLFADKLQFARFMALAPNGDVFLAEPVRGDGQITILRDAQFPDEYRNSAFVALHGSINRSKLSRYSVIRVPFRGGKPSGPPEDFLSGFIARDDEEKQAWDVRLACCSCPTYRCSCRMMEGTECGASVIDM